MICGTEYPPSLGLQKWHTLISYLQGGGITEGETLLFISALDVGYYSVTLK